MKKLLGALLMGMLMLALSACGGPSGPQRQMAAYSAIIDELNAEYGTVVAVHDWEMFYNTYHDMALEDFRTMMAETMEDLPIERNVVVVPDGELITDIYPDGTQSTYKVYTDGTEG